MVKGMTSLVARTTSGTRWREDAMSAAARMTTASDGRTEASTPALDPEVRLRLGVALRAVYEHTCVTEALPDDQVELLLRLRHKERDRSRPS